MSPVDKDGKWTPPAPRIGMNPALRLKQTIDAYLEENCPGHVASESDPKVCGRCGIHIDSLRPPEERDL